MSRARQRGIEEKRERQRQRGGSNNQCTACLYQGNAYHSRQAKASKHAICGALGLSPNRTWYLPSCLQRRIPSRYHPLPPPPPGAQKAGQPLGVYYWAAAGAISPPPRPVASLVPASEPPLSLRLRISSAFTGAGPSGGGQLLFRRHSSVRPSTERVRRTSRILVSTLLLSSARRKAGGVCGAM